MKISTKGRYGLRLMLDLVANATEHEKVSLHQVARRQNISEKYLWQIANRLKAAGLINAVPGANGGYVLNKSPNDISLADILEALEGEFTLVPCVKKSALCSRSVSCASREVWKELNTKISEAMKSILLSDVIEKQLKTMANAPLIYSI